MLYFSYYLDHFRILDKKLKVIKILNQTRFGFKICTNKPQIETETGLYSENVLKVTYKGITCL